MNYEFLATVVAVSGAAIFIAAIFVTKVLPALGNDEPRDRHP